MAERERRDGGRSADNQNNNDRGNRGGRGRRDDRRNQNDERDKYIERVITINRVAKTVKGGRNMSFTALVVVGDGQNFFRVPMIGGTIPHPVQAEEAAGIVMLRPAAPGTGVIAGGAVRPVLEAAGIQDILAKSLGSDNALNVVQATVAGLKQLVRPEEVAAKRGKAVEDVAPARMLRARAGQEA